ncbi:UNVERIFIED_ORG: hypothetical protein GGD59_003288 [Rhizobium esperanzae]
MLDRTLGERLQQNITLDHNVPSNPYNHDNPNRRDCGRTLCLQTVIANFLAKSSLAVDFFWG